MGKKTFQKHDSSSDGEVDGQKERKEYRNESCSGRDSSILDDSASKIQESSKERNIRKRKNVESEENKKRGDVTKDVKNMKAIIDKCENQFEMTRHYLNMRTNSEKIEPYTETYTGKYFGNSNEIKDDIRSRVESSDNVKKIDDGKRKYDREYVKKREEEKRRSRKADYDRHLEKKTDIRDECFFNSKNDIGNTHSIDHLLNEKKVTVSTLRNERSKLISDHFGYSNDDNPFSDRLLSEPFVWKKKNVVLKVAGKKNQTTARALLEASKNKIQEIENVKKRREEREVEEKLLEEQREEMKREKDRQEYEDYARKESLFHRQMNLKKTQIRVEQGRETPMDLIIKGLRILLGERFENMNVLSSSPHTLFELSSKNALTYEQTEEFISDVKLHINSTVNDIDTYFQPFWSALLTVAKDGLQQHRKKGVVIEQLRTDSSVPAVARAAERLAKDLGVRDEESGINVCVSSDIEKILKNKSVDDLERLRESILEKLDDDCDQSYWEAILQKIPLYKARSVCISTHEQVLQKKMVVEREILKEKAEIEAKEKNESTMKPSPVRESLNFGSRNSGELHLTDDLLQDEEESIESKVKRVAKIVEAEVNPNIDGRYSPELEPYDSDNEMICGKCDVTNDGTDDVQNNRQNCSNTNENSTPSSMDIENRSKKIARKYVRGDYSPLLFSEKTIDKYVLENTPIVDEHDDRENRENLIKLLISKERKKRNTILQYNQIESRNKTNENEEILDPANKIITYEDFVRKEKKSLSPDEEIMAPSAEHRLKSLGLDERYKACKPRYFNRVRTGYYWNKYNQTHYDHDNPPPKSVQGYKFNIFYPDLINKNKTPTWTLEPSDTTDTVIIRFHAGPPYEDIAFKIINREWHLEKKRGFRSIFDRGILQLYFSFKKYVYRR